MIENYLHISPDNSITLKKIINHLAFVKNLSVNKEEDNIFEFSSEDTLELKYLKKFSSNYSCTIFYSWELWESDEDDFISFSLIIDNGNVLSYKERKYNIFGAIKYEKDITY